MSESKVILITGMHRSGTSLISSVLHRAGVHIGETLVGPDHGNPRGHFEDVDFFRLHDRILDRSHQSILVKDLGGLEPPTNADREEALGLIDARRRRPLWGWKDPRTALFLRFWSELLPDAKFVFVYRHPFEVVLSLLRRGNDVDAVADPWGCLRSWELYNQQILDFLDTKRASAVVCNIKKAAEDLEGFVDLVAEGAGVSLKAHGLSELFHSAELQHVGAVAGAESFLARLAPSAASVYAQLERTADLPAHEPSDTAKEVRIPSTAVELARVLETDGEVEGPLPEAQYLLLLALESERDQHRAELDRELADRSLMEPRYEEEIRGLSRRNEELAKTLNWGPYAVLTYGDHALRKFPTVRRVLYFPLVLVWRMAKRVVGRSGGLRRRPEPREREERTEAARRDTD